MLRPKRRSFASVLAPFVLIFLLPSEGFAHNKSVHKAMPELAYEILKSAAWEHGQRQGASIKDGFHRPPRAWQPLGLVAAETAGAPSSEEWDRFVADAAKAYFALQTLEPGLPAARAEPCKRANWALPADFLTPRLGDMGLAVNLEYIVGSGCGIDLDWKPGGVYARGANPGDFSKMDVSGNVLGFWAASIDDEVDDTHLWVKILNTGMLGAAKGALNDLFVDLLAAPLVPFVCFFEWIFGGDDCIKDAKNIADKANPIDKIDGLIPGFGDISDGNYTTMWHFINMEDGASNFYDDRQGLYYPDAGLGGVPDPVDVAIMVALGSGGLSINYAKSQGPHRYEVSADDGHQDSIPRLAPTWQFADAGHTPFSPLDNLAYYGWSEFRKQANARWLAWPLHALGDATAPHHLIATSGWGHRPFEDAVENHWHELVYLPGPGSDAAADEALQIGQARRIFVQAFRWRRFILDWRRADAKRANDLPIRDLVTAVAAEQLAEVKGKGNYAFDPGVSTEYALGDEAVAAAHYDGQIDPMREIVERGTAVMIAFLISASEVH